MRTPSLEVAPTVALAGACVGFALSGPTGLLVALLVALAAVAPWPLPFVLGQVGAAVVFGEVRPTLPFALVQVGLWSALTLTTGTGADDRDVIALGVTTAVAGGVLAVAVAVPWGSYLERAVVVTAVIAVGLYVVHRYERVEAGLVTR
jgi:hypothetical protein